MSEKMNESVNLLDLNQNQFNQFLDQFDHVFSDCDGVIWYETPYPGGKKFFELMKKLGKTVNYVSNNSLRTKEMYEDKFLSAGITDGFENLTLPSLAIAEYLKAEKFAKKKVYCVACPETIRALTSCGFQCVYGPDKIMNNHAKFAQYLEDDEDIGAVVFDSDYKVNLPKLYKATTYLARPEVLFLNGATDKIAALKPGVIAMGTGVFSDLVANNTNRVPVQLGKPGKLFGELAMKRSGVTNASRVLFIGDTVDTDIGLGKAVGFKTLFLHTTTPIEDMLSHPKLRSDYYAPDLGSIIPLLVKAVESK